MSANVAPTNIGAVPTNVPQSGWANWLIQIARAVNNTLQGKIGARAALTLTPSATSTTLTDSRIGYFSAVQLQAQTASAATAVAGGVHVTCTKGSATITHPSNAATDQTFSVLIVD